MRLLLLPLFLVVLSRANCLAQPPFDPTDAKSVRGYLLTLTPAGEEQIKKLIAAMGSNNFIERQEAQLALAKIAGPMRKVLEREHAKTNDPEVRKRIASVLNKAEPPTGNDLGAAAAAVASHGHRNLADELLAALANSGNLPSSKRDAIIAAARLSADTEDREGLMEMANSTSPAVRTAACRVLPVFGDAGLAKLRLLLGDEDPSVKLEAAIAVAKTGDKNALPVLAEVAAGDDFYLRWRAVEALRQASAGSIESDPLVKGRFPQEKIAAVEDVQAIGNPRPIDLLSGTFDISKWKVAYFNNYYDIPYAKKIDGDILRIASTGTFAWGCPQRFQNYRLRIEWRFPTGRGEARAGISLGKFAGKPSAAFADWEKPTSFEVEIRQGDTGSLFRNGDLGLQMEIGGAPFKGGIAKIQNPHNEDHNGWNTLEIIEADGSLHIIVNGLLQNHATSCDPEPTCFGLRSEGHEIQIRNMHLEPLPGAVVQIPEAIKEEKK